MLGYRILVNSIGAEEDNAKSTEVIQQILLVTPLAAVSSVGERYIGGAVWAKVGVCYRITLLDC